MNPEFMFSLLADLTLICHVAFVVFVVLTVPLIFLGKWLNWKWIRLRWLRLAHLFGMGVVVVQSWLGIICPLTTLEMYFREKAGEVSYSGSFIEHWLHQLLFWQAPQWVFIMIYTGFAVLILGTKISDYLRRCFHRVGFVTIGLKNFCIWKNTFKSTAYTIRALNIQLSVVPLQYVFNNGQT